MKQIIVFLLLAFVLPLLCVILIMHTTLFHAGVFKLIAYGVEAAAPALAAMLTVLSFDKGRGLKQFFKSNYIDHLTIKMLLIALCLPFVMVGTPKLLNWLLFGGPLNFGSLAPQRMLIICWALIAEELGWRGFLQNKLRPYLNELTLPLVVGVIWAAWHYHYFISGTTSAPLILFVICCVTDSYVYYALTQSAHGNIVPASVFHFSGNFFFYLFLINPEYNKGSTVPYLLYALCSLITAVMAVSITHRRRMKIQ